MKRGVTKKRPDRIPPGTDCETSGNTTHGSGWIVQVRPTSEAARHFRFGYLSPLAPRGVRGQNGNLGGAPM